jgi:hypothetical protein
MIRYKNSSLTFGRILRYILFGASLKISEPNIADYSINYLVLCLKLIMLLDHFLFFFISEIMMTFFTLYICDLDFQLQVGKLCPTLFLFRNEA